MLSPSHSLTWAVLAMLTLASASEGGPARVLRVCFDSNNLPFSNQRGEGFENRIADLIARDLGANVEVDAVLARRRLEIEHILSTYSVPRVGGASTVGQAS